MSVSSAPPDLSAECQATNLPARFQFGMRKLLLVPVAIAVAWWIAIQAAWLCREWVFAEERIAAQVSYHRLEATRLRAEAQWQVPGTNITWALGRDRVCRRIETPMTPAEIDRARRSIAVAARRAAHHESRL